MADRRVVALIGSGAVKGAWQPVIFALRKGRFPDVATDEGANFAMARLVYVGRMMGGSCAKQQEFRSLLREVKRDISSSLTDAVRRQDLQVRPEFDRVIAERVLRDAAHAVVITTNWDDTVARAIRGIDVKVETSYLHGHCGDSNGLYLPTEIVEEPYRDDETRKAMHDLRSRATSAVGQATHIVIYGLSLSPLDAELGQILASGMNGSSVNEVSVIDPGYVGVCERVAGLLDIAAPSTAVYGYEPRNVHSPWKFSVEDCERKRASMAGACSRTR